MKLTFKKLFSNVRIIIMLVFLLLSVAAIHPNFSADGVAIRTVVKNSSADLAGMGSPSPTSTPMSREVIEAINNMPIEDIEDYYDSISDIGPNQTITIKTNKKGGYYRLTTKPLIEKTQLNETEEKIVEEIYQVNETINGSTILVNKTRNVTITVPKYEKKIIGTQDLGLKVYNAPTTNIRKGLDLQGGTRVLLQPEESIDSDTMELLIDNMKQRLNIYGLSDIVVREAGDLSGNQYVVVEIAGASEDEVKDLIASQGKFDARIGNETVFRGGEKDITFVCRTPDCSGIDPSQGCGQIQTSEGNAWICKYRFQISLKPEAAQRQADVTTLLDVITIDEDGNPLPQNQHYLTKTIDFYLDDQQTDSLNIAASLKGRPSTEIVISGSGMGSTQQEAVAESLVSMKRMQTLIITGSLPVNLNIVKTDLLSPSLGEQFVKNALLVGILAILGVTLVVFIRYRKIQIAAPMIINMVSEVILMLGLASLIGWNLDLAAIAGIIIAVGTGVDDQIIIADETIRGEKAYTNWKERIKRAFFIIMGAYFTTVVAMIPLLGAGAGLLKGFAIITIMGVSFGVFVTRPAYAAMVEILLKE